MFKVINRLILVATLLIISACAAQKQLATIPQTIKPGHGFVAVRMITNTSTFDPASIIIFNKWEVVKVIDSKDQMHELILDRSGIHNNSQLFAATLPVGRYTLHSLESPTFHKRVQALLVDNKIEFEIKNQHITSLGSIIYQPTGNGGFAILPMFNDKTIFETLKTSFPKIAGATANSPILLVDQSNIGKVTESGSSGIYIGSFSPFGNIVAGTISSISDAAGATDAELAWAKEKDLNKRMMMAKDRTFAFNDVQELDSGEIVVGSNLGQILIRHPSKGWKRLDTGFPIEFTAMDIVDRKQILAGGEEGILVYSDNTGKTWQQIKAPNSKSLFLDISHHKGEFFVLSRHLNDLVVSSTKNPKSGRWQELLRINDITEATQIRARIESGSAVMSEGKYVVLSPLQHTHVFDPGTRNWVKHKLPDTGFFRLRKHAEGYLYSMRFRYPYISRDNGKTWTEYENGCMRLMDQWYGPNETGYALCFQGAFVVSNSLQKQVGLKSLWQELIPEIPVLTHKLYVSDRRDFLFYVGVNGLVYVSQDGGKTWLEERRTF